MSKSPAPPRVDSAAGWVVVFATMLSTFAVFGVSYSFGAFFTSIREEFGVSNSETALLFAITTFVYFMLGVVTGRLADRFGPRPVMLFGAAMLVVSLLVTSRVTEIWIGYITYGTGVGIGVACAYVPMVAAVGAWFEKYRSSALGVAVAGIGLGTLVGAPTAKALVNAHGWRTGYVIIAIAAGSLLVLASFGARRPPAPTNPAPLPNLWKLISNGRFVMLYISAFLLTLALFVPFVYLDDYLEGYGSERGALLIGLIGASSIIGRLGFGALGTQLSLIRLYQLSFAILASSFLLWLYADGSFALLVMFTVAIGVGYGGFIALSPALTAQMFGPAGLGGILGALYTAAAFGGLIGPPLAGELIDRQGYNTAIETAMWITVAALPALVMTEVLVRRHARAALTASGTAPSDTNTTQSAKRSKGHSTKIGDFDSVLLLSFGGPEGPEDVMPFLEKVTEGRDVPAQRLAKVAEQYLRHGGVSPIGRHNRALVAALREALSQRGYDVPVYLGNRNWHPFLTKTMAEMAANQHTNAVCIVTSSFSSYSGCRQYHEDIAAANAEVSAALDATENTGTTVPVITRVRVFHNHPGFIGAMAERVVEARRGADLSPDAPTIFTAHSLPLSMAAECDYEEQLHDAAAAVAELAELTGPYEVAYQSRSGRASTPWLEPDIGNRLAQLGTKGANTTGDPAGEATENTGVLVVPLGFVADHMEVVHDLDTVARTVAARNHLTMVRTKTVGTHPLFVGGLIDLVEETAGLRDDRPAMGGLGARPDQCAPGCCPAGAGLAAATGSSAGRASKA